jgi:hypothetical protein
MTRDHSARPVLGRLTAVDPRNVWPNEARDFTPWLLENAEVLSDLLGIDLELAVAEHPVGGFSLDLLGRDVNSNAVVIVENQLDGSDHIHLGQLLTYAAGTGAAVVVWVAAGFREEHRLALEWLNEHTSEDIRFFGVEIGVAQIGDSGLAHNFRLAVRPNDWQRSVQSAQSNDATRKRELLFAQFWEAFLNRVREEHPHWTRGQTSKSQFVGMSAGLRGVNWSFWVGHTTATVGLRFETSDSDINFDRFSRLRAVMGEFDDAFGGKLDWTITEGQKMQWVRLTRADEGDLGNTALWDGRITWLIETCEKMRTAFTKVGGLNLVRP